MNWKIKLLVYLLISFSIITSCSPRSIPNQSQPSNEPTAVQNDMIRNIYPPEYLIFQDYLEIIQGRPGKYQEVYIEAIIISLEPGEVCPYNQEECPIEPYPRDFGVIELIRVLSDEDILAEENSLPQEGISNPSEGQDLTSPGNSGASSTAKTKEPANLIEGNSYQALFVLTTKPVIVQYLPITEEDAYQNNESMTENLEDTSEIVLGTMEKEFFSIPTRNGLFFFTTQVGNFPNPVEKMLPGLQIGARFKAHALFDGLLYIEEYELIP